MDWLEGWAGSRREEQEHEGTAFLDPVRAALPANKQKPPRRMVGYSEVRKEHHTVPRTHKRDHMCLARRKVRVDMSLWHNAQGDFAKCTNYRLSVIRWV